MSKPFIKIALLCFGAVVALIITIFYFGESGEARTAQRRLEAFITSGKEYVAVKDIFNDVTSSAYDTVCIFVDRDSEPETAEQSFHRRFDKKQYPSANSIPEFENILSPKSSAGGESGSFLLRVIKKQLTDFGKTDYSVIITLSSRDSLKVVPLKANNIRIASMRYFLYFDTPNYHMHTEGCVPYTQAVFKKINSQQGREYQLLLAKQ